MDTLSLIPNTVRWAAYCTHSNKYRFDYGKLADIIELAKPFIESWEAMATIGSVLAVPPSKARSYQPAEEIAKEIAVLIRTPYAENVLQKVSSTESKGLASVDKEHIRGSIVKTAAAKRQHNMLLVDDVYKSGATMRECVAVLRKDSNIGRIFVLTMTKTRTEEDAS